MDHTTLTNDQQRQRQRQRHRQEYRELLERFELRQTNLTDTLDPEYDRPDNLITGVLGSKSPACIGAAAKSCKSLIATDLAVCLSSRGPAKFLGHFPTADDGSCHVVYLDLEGTDNEFQQRLRRIETARGGEVNHDRLHVFQRFPSLVTDKGLHVLGELLDHLSAELLIVDCLYAALPNVDFTRLSRVGGCLAAISDACRECGTTPLYIHHFNACRASGLAALTGCGLAEHVAQWILLDRIGVYDPATGGHRFRLDIGARSGIGGTYDLTVTEGRLTDPGGRRWDTTVQPLASAVDQTSQPDRDDDSGDDVVWQPPGNRGGSR